MEKILNEYSEKKLPVIGILIMILLGIQTFSIAESTSSIVPAAYEQDVLNNNASITVDSDTEEEHDDEDDDEWEA